jgi:hypothetical protein
MTLWSFKQMCMTSQWTPFVVSHYLSHHICLCLHAKILKLCLSITLIFCTHCWFHTGPTVVSLPLDDTMRVITEQLALGIDIPQCIRMMVKVKKVLNFKRCRMCLIRMRSWADPSNYLGHCCWWGWGGGNYLLACHPTWSSHRSWSDYTLALSLRWICGEIKVQGS